MIAVAATGACVAVIPTAATAAPKVRLCGLVAFTPNSDDGAFRIRAKGVDCRTARAVARASRGRGPIAKVGTRFRYSARGFVCSGIEIEDGLAAVNYRCTRKGATITFQKS